MNTLDAVTRRARLEAQWHYRWYLGTGDLHSRYSAYGAVWIITGRYFTHAEGWGAKY